MLNMKKLIVFLFASTMIAGIQAQPNNQVIASAGSYATFTSGGSTYSNSYTVGELAAIETYSFTSSGNTYYLTQGFQQPNGFYISVPEITAVKNSKVAVYPNPSSGVFYASYDLLTPAKVETRIYNIIGEVVFSNSDSKQYGQNNDRIDITALSQGIYLLEYRFITNKGEPSKVYQKINLTH